MSWPFSAGEMAETSPLATEFDVADARAASASWPFALLFSLDPPPTSSCILPEGAGWTTVLRALMFAVRSRGAYGSLIWSARAVRSSGACVCASVGVSRRVRV